MSDTLKERMEQRLRGGGSGGQTDIDPETGEVIEPAAYDRSEIIGRKHVTASAVGLSSDVLSGTAKLLLYGEKRHVLTIFGQIRKIALVEDTRAGGQKWKALYGAFEARNELTGDHISGSTCFLPIGAQHRAAVDVAIEEGMVAIGDNKEEGEFPAGEYPQIAASLERALRRVQGERSRWEPPGIQFAIRYFVTPSKAPGGYSWAHDMDLPPVKADPLAALREKALAPRKLPAGVLPGAAPQLIAHAALPRPDEEG